MNFLAISSSQKRASLSFFLNSEVVITLEAEREFQPSQWLTPAILMISQIYDNLLESLDFIAIDRGPGSFTGIKVGIAFVKGLTQKNSTPIVSVDSLSANAILGPENSKIAVIKKARKDLYYFGLYEKEVSLINVLIEPTILTKAEVFERLNNFDNFISYADNGDFDEFFDKKILKNSPPLSEGVGLLALERFKRGHFFNERDIKPLYIREPDAVINLKFIN